MPIVFQICVEGNRGSTGTMAEGLGEILISNQWESFIGYGRFKRPSKSKTIKIGNKLSILFHGLLTRIFDMHGLGSKIATYKLVDKIKDIKPDIIHLHHLHGYYINIKILFNFLRKQNIPVVWTFHDCWSITGHCTHFDYVKCDKWKTACYKCPQTKEYPSSHLFDRSFKNYFLKKELFNSLNNLHVVTVSNWLDKVIDQSFLSKTSRSMIYNGIDVSLFCPQGEKYLMTELNNKFVILGVSNTWNSRKGLFDFIHLSKRLNENEIIVLVGLNKSQIRKLPKNVIGIERTESQNELRDLYNRCDVYMNLSAEETFGLTTAEALACGVPCIVYNSTASPELINSSTGVIVNNKDFTGLANAIIEIKSKDKMYYSKACRERAVKLFNKNNTFKEYFNLYKKILENNP